MVAYLVTNIGRSLGSAHAEFYGGDSPHVSIDTILVERDGVAREVRIFNNNILVARTTITEDSQVMVRARDTVTIGPMSVLIRMINDD